MSKVKPNANDLRRSIGYQMITFLGVFMFLPVLWFIRLFSQDAGIYVPWLICSSFLVVINILLYYWKYPKDWLKNLFVLIGINLLILLFEYFWLYQSMGK